MKQIEVQLSDALHAALIDFAAAHGITPAGAAARMVAVALGVGAMEGEQETSIMLGLKVRSMNALVGSSGHCIGCLVELGALDDDLNGDGNCVCARCRAEERHDFDAEPQTRYDRAGRRIDTANTERHAPSGAR